jgi:hypothetical protein
MERPTTIVDVAKRAGVAISSASSALNGRPGVSDATRTRVREAADELGFVPSLRGRSLSSKRAYAVGLIVSRDADVFEEDPFFGGFLAGIESVLGARGYALVLQMSTTVEENTERYRRMALDRRVDGVLVARGRDHRGTRRLDAGRPARQCRGHPGTRRLPLRPGAPPVCSRQRTARFPALLPATQRLVGCRASSRDQRQCGRGRRLHLCRRGGRGVEAALPE